MRQARIVEVDRSNRERAIASLRQAGELLRTGIHVWIAPEGTRSRDGKLGTMKKGGFILAHDTGTPILPIAISHTRDVLAPKSATIRRGVRVKVVFGKPVEVDGKRPEDLMERVRSFLEAQVETE
jgi:1-acyl-sn-glycerol-3-phosphate acyltransferase